MSSTVAEDVSHHHRSYPRSSAGQCPPSADDAAGSDAWPCMQSVVLWTPAGSVLHLLEGHVDRCWGLGTDGSGWMEELSTGIKEKGRARVCVRYDFGYGWYLRCIPHLS